MFWYWTTHCQSGKIERWSWWQTEGDRQPGCLSFTFPGWAEDSASGDAMHGAVPGKEAYARNRGEGTSAYTDTHWCTYTLMRTHTHTHTHTNTNTHKHFTKHRGPWTQHLQVYARTNWQSTTTQTHSAHKDFIATNQTHAHIPYANELQRLHGMWQMPSSPAHILFPDRTRARLFTQGSNMAADEKRHWWKTVFKSKSLLFFFLNAKM